MKGRFGLGTTAVAAVCLMGGCSQPPIADGVAQELQVEVQEIAALTARGDTAEAVAAAQSLAERVREGEADGNISEGRAGLILERVDELLDGLAGSGAAPAPVSEPAPVAQPEPSFEPAPAPVAVPDDNGGDGGADQAGSDSGPGSGGSGATEVAAAPGDDNGDDNDDDNDNDDDVADRADDDDDSGQGRGRGRGRGGDD